MHPIRSSRSVALRHRPDSRALPRRRRRGKCALTAFLVVAPAVVDATSAGATSASGAVWVSPSGSDRNPCTAAEPCATISHAVNAAPSGGTVKVKRGTYDQVVVIEKPITLVGQRGAVVDGWGQDPGAPLLGVLYIGGPGGTTASEDIGGDVTVRGLTLEDPNPDAQTYGDGVCLQPVIVGVYDGDPTDVITITHDTLLEGTADPAAVDDGPIGLDTLDSWSRLVVTHTSIRGVWQGLLLEDNGPSSVTRNRVSDLITFNAPDAGTSLHQSPTEPEQCVAQAQDDGTTTYASEGVTLLADDAGEAMADQTVAHNRLFSYAGDGVDLTAAYGAGHLRDVEVGWNDFDLGGFAASGAVRVVADDGGTVSHATIEFNRGSVAAPSDAITEDDSGGPPSGGTISDVTVEHDRIRSP